MRKWQLYTSKEIKPKGWLKRQLEIQAEGLSGNLDKMWPDVRDSAWIGGDREGWERVPYWLDGFIPLAYLLENEDMIGRAKKYIDAIIAQQQADGWICPCSEEERATYDTWAVQLITKVLVLYYECAKDERIPAIIYSTLKNYYDLLKTEQIKLFAWGKSRWFEALIAINFTYARYQEPWLKDLARILKEQGQDYNRCIELWKKPLNYWKHETHIVNLGMMFKAEAVSCDLLDEAYTDNAEFLREIMDRYNGTVYESFTGDECLSGISPIQGTELCGIVEQMYSYELLYAYTGDSKWAQRLEVLAFNALPATISEDMWTHQYVQMSNQIACEQFHGKPIFSTDGDESHLFGLEPNYGCCTANFNQGWPKFALTAFMHRGDTLINSMLLPCEFTDGDKRIVVETDYPFKHSAKYTISAAKDFTFVVRIPAFAESVTINGEKVVVAGDEISFAIAGGKDTQITLAFAAKPEFKARPNGLTALQWGSVLFSVPISYTTRIREYEKDGVVRQFPYCDYELIPQSEWNYGFSSRDTEVKTGEISHIPFSESKPPVTIKAKLRQIDWGFKERYESVCAELPRSLVPISEEKEMELYPYGCAKLRMTELPFVSE